ncbi:hypothetical protein L9F63_012348, partial [Diploptera punctata]
YLASKSYNSCYAPLKFLDALFRGYGQVVFANNPISGVIIFIGLTFADPQVSAAGLLTAIVGLFTSIAVIPQPNVIIISGLTVFNPLLIGLVTATALPHSYGIQLEYWHFFLMILASVVSVYVTSAFENILGSVSRYPLPYLTVPFNVVQQLLFLVLLTATSGGHVTSQSVTMATQAYTEEAAVVSTLSPGHIYSDNNVTRDMLTDYDGAATNHSARNEADWGGVFSGIVLSSSQVYAFNYAPTAVLIYIALLLYSPITAAFGLLGAVIGTLTGVLLTDPGSYAESGGVYDGSWGFNGMLSSMCLGGLFFVISWSSTLAAVLSAIFSTVLQYVLISPFAQGKLVPMSLPFNLSALLFLCVTTSRGLARPQVVSFPEKHRLEHKPSQEREASASDEMNKDLENAKKSLQTEDV